MILLVVCHYHGVLADKSVGVFDANVLAPAGVNGIVAEQTNHNLLLNLGPVINTKPQLQINTDGIKCSHGATVGQLDQMALFYLCTRGIDKTQAQSILIQSFLIKPVMSSEFLVWQDIINNIF